MNKIPAYFGTPKQVKNEILTTHPLLISFGNKSNKLNVTIQPNNVKCYYDYTSAISSFDTVDD